MKLFSQYFYYSLLVFRNTNVCVLILNSEYLLSSFISNNSFFVDYLVFIYYIYLYIRLCSLTRGSFTFFHSLVWSTQRLWHRLLSRNRCFSGTLLLFWWSADVGNLISGSSAFSKTNLNIWKFTVRVLLKPGLENFECYLTSVWDECNCVVVWAFFALPFFGIGMKTDLFQSCGHCWVLQICWHIECSTFTASSFRIWNSSSGVLSPQLALFIVMLPKVHLTSHSRMSGYRWMWVITPSWLSGLWRSFLYSSVYSCRLFLISSASVRSIQFLSFIQPIFAWNVPWYL